MNQFPIVSFVVILFSLLASVSVAQEQTSTNSTTSTKKLFTYAGSLLPSDWTL